MGKYILILVLLNLMTASTVVSNGFDHYCVQNTVTNPVFTYTSGGFNPDEGAEAESCATLCSVLGFTYVAIEEASNCFCSSTLDGLTTVDVALCDQNCRDGMVCGGVVGILSAYIVEQIVGLISTPQLQLAFIDTHLKMIEVERLTIVNVIINATHPYIIDFGDGTGRINKNIDTTIASNKYTMEGHYYITVTEPITGISTRLEVLVYSSRIRLDINCPSLIATGEPFTCTFARFMTSWPSILTVNSQETQSEHNYTIPALDSRIYGHVWDDIQNNGQPGSQETLSLTNCGETYALQTPIGEDEALTMVELNAIAGDFKIHNIYQCSGSCTRKVVRSCESSNFLCGNTCHSDSASCPSPWSPKLTEGTVYNGIITNSHSSSSSTQNIVSLNELYPNSFFAVSCYDAMSNNKVLSRKADLFGEAGDHKVTKSSYQYTPQKATNTSIMMRFRTYVGRITTLGPIYNCTKPSVLPTSNFNGNNAISLAKSATWTLGFTMSGGSRAGGHTSEITRQVRCQTNITIPHIIPPSQGSTNITIIAIPFLTGAPVAISLTVEDGSSTLLMAYIDEVPEGGMTSYVEYVASTSGKYSVNGEATNELCLITFNLDIEVIPVILQHEWIFTTSKPWATPPGDVTLDLTCLGSDDPPWMANLTLMYEGQIVGEELDMEIDPNNAGTSGFTFHKSLTFTLASLNVNNHTLIANLSNQVSWIILSVQVDIREAISGISTTWGLQMTPDSEILDPGSVDGITIFPASIPVVFTSNADKGIVEYWGLFDEENQKLTYTNTSLQSLIYTFTDEGMRNLTVKAYSVAEGWVSAEMPLLFKVLFKIQGMEVTDFNIITHTNQTKTFSVSFKIGHPISCLLIDYNDGSLSEAYGAEIICRDKFPNALYIGGPLTNPHNITHVYMEENLYNVTVMAVDLLTSLRTLLPVVVAYLPCKAPIVWIPDNTTFPPSAPKLWRSRSFKIDSDAIIDCNGTVATRKTWTIQKVEGEEGIAVADIEVEGILASWNFSQLTVPPRLLDYGTYLFTYKLQLLASKIFPLFRTAYTYVQVTKSPLQAVIIKGGMTKVSRGYGDIIDLDPAQYSQDPDWPQTTDLKFTWFCRRMDIDVEHTIDAEGRPVSHNIHTIPQPYSTTSSTNAGCFNEGPGKLDYTDGRLVLNTASFSEADKTYEIMVMVERDTRFAMAKVMVEVMRLSPPAISIVCADPNLCQPTFSGLLVNPSSRVALSSICTDYCHDDMQYEWRISSMDEQAVVETKYCPTSTKSDTEESSLAPDPCPPVIPTGKTSRDIALSSDLFLLNHDLEKFKLTLKVQVPGGAKGEYVMTLVVNKPPRGGTCTVVPQIGRAMVDIFKVMCKDWNDPEEAGVDHYTYFKYEDTEGARLKRTIIESSRPDAELILPIGAFTIYCEIWDKFGTYTEVNISTVQAVLPTQEEVEEYKAGEKIEYLSAIGDQFKIGMLLTAQASIREQAPWLSLNMDALTNMTTEQVDERLRDVAKMNTDALKTATDTMSFGSLGQLNVGAGVLRAATEGVSTNAAAAKTVDMEARETALDLLNTMTNSLGSIEVTSPQDMVPFLSASLSAMGSIMTGVTEILDGKNAADSVPPTDTEAAKDWDYEVDIGDDINLQIPTTRKAMLERNVMETTRLKAKDQVTKMMSMLQSIGIAMEKKSVEGEAVLSQASNGASMMVAKLSEQSLKNGMKVAVKNGGGQIELPKMFCPSSYLGRIYCNDSFSITAVEWSGVTHSYASSATQLSKHTGVVSMEVFLQGKLVNISGLNDGIIIDIPRQPETLPDCVVVSNSEAKERMLHVPLVYHQFNVTSPGSALNIEFEANGTSANNMIMLLSHEYLPTPQQHELFVHMEDVPQNDHGITDLFLGIDIIKNRTGRFFLAVGALADTFANTFTSDTPSFFMSNFTNASRPNLTSDILDWNYDANYSVRIFTSGCYYFDNEAGKWSSLGMEVVSSWYLGTRCKSSHLTDFATGFLHTPNTLTFHYIFANAGFTDNLSIYVTIIITASTMLVLLIWARIMDYRDVKKVGVTPLVDNDPHDRYMYELVVYTGSANDASTRSNVQVVLCGDYGESEVRTLEDKERTIFNRNGIDSFVMVVPRPLGELQYLRIWHDNSGGIEEKGNTIRQDSNWASWQLAFISVRDLQTKTKTIFLANRWLAIDRDDGQIDVTLCAADTEGMENFSHLYEAQKQRGIKDSHIWLSVFFRPPRSRYCRVERVGVCCAFLYLSMMASAAWYNYTPEQPNAEPLLTLGPFTFTRQQAEAALMFLVVVYPVVQLAIFMFRRSVPFKTKMSRAFTARHTQQILQLNEAGLPAEEIIKLRSDNNSNKTIDIKPRPLLLPWWCRVLAWLLVLTSIGVSIFFVWAFAIQFGAEKTSRWLSSYIITFFISFLVVEPLMVVLGAVMYSICCKKSIAPRVDADDVDFDEILPHLQQDEEWQHHIEAHGEVGSQRKIDMVAGNRDTSLLEELRQQLVKEREMLVVLKGVLAYLLFMAMLVIITDGNKDYSAFHMVNHFRNAFIKQGDRIYDYQNKVKDTDDYWRWLKRVMLDELRAQRWYNGEPPYGLRGFLDDKQNRIMGYAILRQIRNAKNVCKPPQGIRKEVFTCTGDRGQNIEDTRNYCAGWFTHSKYIGACQEPEFKYRTSEELQAYPASGRLGQYSGGGYVFELKGPASKLLHRLDYIQRHKWIDKHTRAVMLEFTVYNANVNLFGTAVVMAEFHPGGGLRPYWYFDSTRLITPNTPMGYFIWVNEIAFIVATVYFTIREIWQCYKSGILVYFSSYWNIAEVAIIIASYSAIGVYYSRYWEVQRVLKVFESTKGNGYVRMELAAILNQFYVNTMALIEFFSIIKFIKILQFNKRMNLLGFTLSRCWNDLQVFFVTFGIIFFAFTTIFFSIFNLSLVEFSTLMKSLQMCFSMMLGKFDFQSMVRASSLSPVIFFVFSLSTSMILINLMLTIIIRTFTQVKAEMKNVPNKYDIVDFITNKTLVAFGVRKEEKRIITSKPKITYNISDTTTQGDNTEELPEKVDALLAYINNTYFEGHLNMHDGSLKSFLRGTSTKKNVYELSDGFDTFFEDETKPKRRTTPSYKTDNIFQVFKSD